MALTQDRNTPRREGVAFAYPMAAATTIFAGGIVMLNAAGNAVPGDEAVDQICVGRADQHLVNAGSAGDAHVLCSSGVFRFNNSAAADEITIAEVGDACWIVDDETVAKTSAEVESTPTRSVAGTVVGVDDNGVWVRMGL